MMAESVRFLVGCIGFGILPAFIRCQWKWPDMIGGGGMTPKREIMKRLHVWMDYFASSSLPFSPALKLLLGVCIVSASESTVGSRESTLKKCIVQNVFENIL